MACDLRQLPANTLMAAKVRMLKLLQEIRGFAEIVNRQPPPRSTGLLLAQMRPHVIQAVLPRRNLKVTTVPRDHANIPHPVKINRVKQARDPAAMRPVP